MSGESHYVKIKLDLSDLDKPQEVLVLPTLTPPELLGAIIEEFRGTPHLIPNPAAYRLTRADTGTLLDDELPLARQLGPQLACRLHEYCPPLPQGAVPMGLRIYLREQIHGTVYPLHWQPALIGRPDDKLLDNDLLAVNVAAYTTGLRVSRRHAQVISEAGQVYLENLGQNATHVTAVQGTPVEVTGRQLLSDGAMIELVRSQIKLMVIMRPRVAAP